MKVHMGCGAVYLTDYINVDIPTPRTFLAHNRPDLVERYRTTDDAYYARHQDKTIESLSAGPLDQEYVCDRYGSFFFLPVAEPIAELLARHSFEHLSITEARTALDMLHRHMHKGSLLRLDVPSHEDTMKLYCETRNPFYERHMFGPQRGDYGFHTMSYSPERLIRLAAEHGFYFLSHETNIHIYPAFCIRFMRSGRPGF